jgi:lipopolysaccharide/colanic/teichoic acid biosynthesis glycosyltransferase
MEASLMETPSVVTNIRGCRETVEEGANGLLTPVRDAAALAEAIKRLLGDEGLRAAMGETGRRMALAKFDERRVHAIVENEYSNLLRRHGPSARFASTDPRIGTKDELRNYPSDGTAYRGKRLFDLALSALLLPLALPLGAICAALVYFSLGRPIFFRQERPGLDGNPFKILKFRTMTFAAASPGQLLPDSQRLTAIGRLLRRTSLDELPEILNVLRGDMSIVGPRPLLVRYLPYFSATERLRFAVRPGITGWAQVNGRNRLDWDARLRHDVWYVENANLSLDIRILIRTLSQALIGENVEVAPSAAMLDLDELRSRSRVVQEG